ncbi:MAG: ABC transporter ATP-binding protein [Rhodobacteraceae bacterium]|nr:ABC transporter ATP-binding protein [Paracoccaceae bacterium]
MARIQLRGIQKRWGAVWGVRDVDIDIADKEFLVLLGPSGCGKTTTMRMIAGLEDPSEGEIVVDGEVMNEVDARDRDVAMVFQGYALYPNMSIYENIRFPLRMRNVPKDKHDALVRRAADMVELTEYLDRKPGALSGGQRQRAALARAIVREPQVFLMDEPLSNLDAKLRVSTRAQIKNLSHELAVTTVYVTHDQIEAMTLADRVVVMEKGVVQQVGSPTEIYDTPANTFVASFIGSPAMNLINGEVKNDAFVAEHTRLEGMDLPDGPVTLGFRAEDATIAETGQITAPIYTMELLGDATMISVRIGGALVSVKADKTYRADIGDMMSIQVPKGIRHLFEAGNGARIGGDVS